MVIPINLNYLGSFLELLAVIADGSNRATESRCQNYFPLDSIQRLLEDSKGCWFLKEKVVGLYYHVYLDQENVLLENQVEINAVTEILVKDFEILFKSIHNPADQKI